MNNNEEHLEAVEREVARLKDVAGTEGFPHLAGSIAVIGEAVAHLLAKPKVGRPPKQDEQEYDRRGQGS